MKKKQSALKVGFDLDGVILYNPARIARPIIAQIKHLLFGKKRDLKFYHPKTEVEKWFWWLFHKSSIYIAPGLDEVKKLVKTKKIKAYLITSRYSFLKNDLKKWLKKTKIDQYFDGIYYNKNDEEPHLFKERMINKLKLDVFVEDNWDIVKYLNLKFKIQPRFNRGQNLKLLWIYNIFDRSTSYSLRFPRLKQAVDFIKSNL